MQGIARAAVASLWRRFPLASKTARPSACISWRYRSTWRFTHAISYRRLVQLFLHLYALRISEGCSATALLQCAKPCFDSEVPAILARLRRSRIGSDETTVRIDGRTHWNRVFQNDQMVIHVVRNSRAASVVTETMVGHRPSIWVSDLYGAQQGHRPHQARLDLNDA